MLVEKVWSSQEDLLDSQIQCNQLLIPSSDQVRCLRKGPGKLKKNGSRQLESASQNSAGAPTSGTETHSSQLSGIINSFSRTMDGCLMKRKRMSQSLLKSQSFNQVVVVCKEYSC